MDMKFSELERVIAEQVAAVKGNSRLARKITSDTNLVEEVGLDSLELTDLVTRLEDVLGLTVDYEAFDIGHLQSVRHLARFLRG
jgi:acyl carrier protein